MLVPARLGLRRTARTHCRPQLQPHLRPSVLHAGPDGSPLEASPARTHRATARRSALPPRSEEPAGHFVSFVPFCRESARASFNFASFGTVMKDASRFQTQELLSSVPPRCRFPLAREPLGTRVPAASSQASCRGRYTVGLRRPGALKITASCVQRPLRAWHESLLAAGCSDPAPPPATQCSRQSLRHPSRQPLTPLV